MATRRIGILVFPGYQGLDVVGPYEVFRGADDALQLSGSPERYEVILIGEPNCASETGLSIGPVVPPHEVGALDTLILPGGRGVRSAAEQPATVKMAEDLAQQAARLATVCTGAFLLAATGRLSGRTVATHWAYAEELASRFPTVSVDGDSIYRQDGHIWSSAGVTAGIDLALALVDADVGPEVAHLVSCWLVVFLRRPGGQRQFARATAGPPPQHGAIAQARQFIHQNLAEDLRVETLAGEVALSQRHFARLFRSETGLTPAAYVQQRRLDAARDLLESTSLPLNHIARNCGLGSSETLRRVMADQVGVSPEAYRSRFSH